MKVYKRELLDGSTETLFIETVDCKETVTNHVRKYPSGLCVETKMSDPPPTELMGDNVNPGHVAYKQVQDESLTN